MSLRCWPWGLPVAIVLVTCQASTPTRVEHPSGETPMLLSAEGPATPSAAELMRKHDARGRSVRDAIARADLDAAKRAARGLAELPLDAGTEPTWRSNVDALRTAVDEVTRATDLTDASRALAAVARTCGNCHAAVQATSFLLTSPAPRGVSVGARMARHAWAMERLWEALIGPSNEAWLRGIGALRDAPLAPERLTPGQSPVPEIGELARIVRTLAEEGRTAESGSERGKLYGLLLTTCAGCHRRLGGMRPSHATFQRRQCAAGIAPIIAAVIEALALLAHPIGVPAGACDPHRAHARIRRWRLKVLDDARAPEPRLHLNRSHSLISLFADSAPGRSGQH